jgi:hypothetical protein
MLERNAEVVKEIDKLEKKHFQGQIILHWKDGVVLIVDWPKKPVRKELVRKTETTAL